MPADLMGQGEPGAAGAKGDSCTVVTNEDGTATIKCTDGTAFDIVNGQNGKNGDAGSDGLNGQNGQSCYMTENLDGSLAVVCPYDGSSYLVRGNTGNYANYCQEGFWGKNCENECHCGQHQVCNDGVTGDGSCNCTDSWSGADCSICQAGFLANGDNCFNCAKGAENSYFGQDECTFTDSRDNRVYRVVTIGEQLWMAENLKAQKDNDNNAVTCHADFQTSEAITNCSNRDDCLEKYGCLYVWAETANICPEGWHLPDVRSSSTTTDHDFNKLWHYVDEHKTTNTVRQALNADTNVWIRPDDRGNDEFGFGLLPTGYSNVVTKDSGDSMSYNNFGQTAYLWSSTPSGNGSALNLRIYQNEFQFSSNSTAYYIAVRCVKDAD